MANAEMERANEELRLVKKKEKLKIKKTHQTGNA